VGVYGRDVGLSSDQLFTNTGSRRSSGTCVYSVCACPSRANATLQQAMPQVMLWATSDAAEVEEGGVCSRFEGVAQRHRRNHAREDVRITVGMYNYRESKSVFEFGQQG
jgi:hypothetical protein